MPPPDRDQLIRALNEQMLGAWDLYIKFFSVFLTVNAAALALVFQYTDPGAERKVVAISFVGQNVIAFVTGVMMARYTRRIGQRFRDLDAEPLTDFTPLGHWGGTGNAIGHVVLGLLWSVVFFVR